MLRLKFAPVFTFLVVCGILTIYSTRNSRNVEEPAQTRAIDDDSVILINKAYWEQIDPSSARIRILSFSKCNVSDFQLKIGESTETVKLKPTTRSVEGDCPWHWAPGCEWNSFITDATIDLGNLEAQELKVLLGTDRVVNLPLEKVPSREEGLAVCVPPLYWYADWLRLAFFIETWKASGASHFYVYVQSISKSVKSVLDSYAQDGILTVVEWPLLPKSDGEDPNKSVYRLGHSLSHNDCRLRVKKRFAALVDVDEFILPAKPNRTLVEFLGKKLKAHPLAGSFNFKHLKLHFPDWPKSNSWENFDWIRNVAAGDSKDGPTKSIFVADRADIILTHKIRNHFGIFSEVEVEEKDASLYHSRLNWITNSSDFNKTVNFFVENAGEIADNLKPKLEKADEKLETGLNLNNTIIGTLIVRCLAEWQTFGCKTPFDSCRESISPLDDWIISEAPSMFTIL